VIEVKLSNVNKGRAAQRWLSGDGQHDFTLAIGDDVTDEDLFEAMPDDGITVKVGRAPQSAARYHLVEASQVRELLRALLAAE
jgi:trehalose 6-phosphate synthase/phosphatase